MGWEGNGGVLPTYFTFPSSLSTQTGFLACKWMLATATCAGRQETTSET